MCMKAGLAGAAIGREHEACAALGFAARALAARNAIQHTDFADVALLFLGQRQRRRPGYRADHDTRLFESTFLHLAHFFPSVFRIENIFISIGCIGEYRINKKIVQYF